MSSPETMQDVFNILEPHGVLSAEDIGALRSMLSERLISEIGAMAPHQLAAEIIVRREAHGLTTKVIAAKLAKALLNFMHEMGHVSAASTTELPPKIELVQKTHLRDMTLRELLEALVADRSRYDELVVYIKAQAEVQVAERRSPNWAVAAVGQPNQLDVSATLTRVSSLRTDTIVHNKLPDGRYPTSIARIFGQEERYMINPFAVSLNEQAVRGPIFGGFDLNTLPEERHLAYIWASGTRHHAWPSQIDPYDHIGAAFASQLSGRWLEIVQDYQAARQNGEPSTEGLTRYAPTGSLRSRRPFDGGAPKRDESWYKEQLEQRASRRIEQHHSSVRIEARIVRSISTTHATIKLRNVIVLGNVNTTHAKIEGTFYVHNSATVSTTHDSITASIIEMNYKGLYEKALALGLISE